MLGRRHERGDTIIEVMFAFVLFSMVIVGAFMIMNQGMALAQRSLEVTQVRQQIDSQVLLIRTAQQAVNQQLWETIKGKVGTTTPITLSELAESNCRLSPDTLRGRGAFFVALRVDAATGKQVIRLFEPTNASYQPEPTTYSKVDFGNDPRAQGLFVQIVKAEGANANLAYDVYVSACWPTVASDKPMTIGTVTRLYDVAR